MDPEIRYARTSDGVDIAYFRHGSGPPLVVLPYLPMSHLAYEWQVRPLRQWLEWFSGHRTLIRYDARLTGLSTGGADSQALTLDDHVRDLEAVVAAIDAGPVDLLAGSFAGPIGIAFAARRPECVRHLALWTTHASHADVVAAVGPEATAQSEAIETLAALNLEMFLRAWIHRAVGWLDGEVADQAYNLVRNSIEPESFPVALRAYRSFDASADLAHVPVPTLVMHRRDFGSSNLSVARGLTSRIAGARMALFEGESVIPFIGDGGRVLATIDEFIGPEGVVNTRLPLPGSTAPEIKIILFSDIEGHTPLTRRLGDRRAREFLREHERITREALASHDGTEWKSLGDGFMATFSSAQRALECAVALQRTFERLAREGDTGAKLRIGLNAGEPIEEDGDLFGSSVIIAARISENALGGEIIAANVVRELITGNEAAFGFEDRGLQPLKGFDTPFHLHAVRW